jgi:hypothetical protein
MGRSFCLASLATARRWIPASRREDEQFQKVVAVKAAMTTPAPEATAA